MGHSPYSLVPHTAVGLRLHGQEPKHPRGIDLHFVPAHGSLGRGQDCRFTAAI